MAKTVVRRKDIIDTAVAAGHFFRFCEAAEAAGLKGTLRSFGPFTVFAPTDNAFAKLGPDIVKELLKPRNVDALGKVVRYHITEGHLTAAEVQQAEELTTLCDEPIIVTLRPGKIMVDTATIIERDIECYNGMLHGIDAVMLPRK